MTMWQAGMAVAMVLIGGIAALLGGVVLLSSLSSGSIALSYGAGSTAVAETVTHAGDPSRFMYLVALLGGAPFVLGGLAAWWGMRRLRR